MQNKSSEKLDRWGVKKMAKAKRLTVREKKYRAELRKDMREQGLMPPVKPKLNRKKFVKEVHDEYSSNFNSFDDVYYLYEAIGWMLPTGKYKTTITLEEIGVAKLLKIAMDIKKFHKEKLKNGEKKYKLDDLYKTVIEPIRNL